MNAQISALSGYLYTHIAKPVFFMLPPDTAHSMLLGFGSRLRSVAPVKALMSSSWAYKNERVLSQTRHGVHFVNPIGLSAGFDKNIELPPVLKAIGFGFMEAGSITALPTEGNARPWFQRLVYTESLIVHAGLANQGVAKIMARLARYPVHTFNDFPLNISIAYTNDKAVQNEQQSIDDYVESARQVQHNGRASMITLNISCPNTYGGEPFTSPAKLEKLLSRIDDLGLDEPLFLKMPSDLNWRQFNNLLKVARNHKVAGLTICNLAKTRHAVDARDKTRPLIAGGLSGAPVRDLSNALIEKTYAQYGRRFTIIGVGGVFTAEDAYAKIKLGASLVELITGMIYFGPQRIGQINRDLAILVQQDGYTSIEEAIGADNKLKV